MTCGIRIQHGAGPHRQAMANLDVRQLVDACAECAVEHVRLAEGRAVIEPHSGLDEGGSLVRGDRCGRRDGGSRRHDLLCA